MSAEKVRYTPLYLQVKEVLLNRITNNIYKPGDVIPSEATLAEDFGASVSTIRQALSILAADGVLVKKQGKGTFISEKKTRLRFFSWIGDREAGKRILLHTIKLFEKKYPRFDIEYIPTSYHGAKQELVKLITSGNAPDIVQIMAHWTGYFASMGALTPLDTLLKQENLDNRFYEKDLYGGMFRGTLYSVAWGLCPVALIANKHVLREAGVTLPASPMTLETFRAICQQIDQFYGQREKYSYALSVSSDKETDFLTMYAFLQAFKGGFITEQGESIVDSAANVAAFTWLREFVKSCRVFTSDILTIRERFAHNDIAFISDGPWMKYLLEDVTGREFDQDFVIVSNPVYREANSSSWNDNHALAICSQSPYAAYAATFIDALTNDAEIFRYYTSKTGLLPVNKISLDDPLYGADFFKGYTQQLAHATCINAQHAMFSRAMYFCMDAVKKILYEEADIEQELHEKAYYVKMLYSE